MQLKKYSLTMFRVVYLVKYNYPANNSAEEDVGDVYCIVHQQLFVAAKTNTISCTKKGVQSTDI